MKEGNIMPEDIQRTLGRDAQRTNILAAKLIAETIRTTLGPKGMDKMLVDTLGEVIVTNDGVTILEEMQIEHPSAKMIVEVAKTQEHEVGDGTTTAVILVGELLKNAERLLDQDIHPTVIAKGYRIASEKAQTILLNLAVDIDEKDKDVLKKIAMTAMTGKGAELAKEKLAEISVSAVKQVMEKIGDEKIFDIENIKLEKKTGSSVDKTEFISGIVLDKEKVNVNMPSFIKDGKIMLLDSAIEVKSSETDAKIQITDPNQMNAFIEMEEKMIRDMVEKITETDANIVICQKGIDELAQHFLAKKGIFAIRRVKKSDMDKLARATGAKIITNLDDFSGKDLGKAGIVQEKKVGDEIMTYVEDCKNPKSVTILVRGGTGHVIEEVKRAIEDAIDDVSAALKNNKVVAGAASTEMELARNLRHFASTLSGREQLAVLAFSEAMEVIAKTLAENAGLDPIDVLTELKAAHEKGEKWAGINVFSGKIMDAWKEGVIEPLKIKTQAISSASETAIMILRIDDIIAAGNLKREGGGMPPEY